MTDEEADKEASERGEQIEGTLASLAEFRETIFQQHLNFDLSANNALSAKQDVQNIKESLDSWRDEVKAQLDAVDVLLRDSAHTLTPEQYAQLREKRQLLAADYESVVRTVEIVYQRLNIIASLLIEFSTHASATQSWVTDKTRQAGDIRLRSTDPRNVEQVRSEGRMLLEEVTEEESRLKVIGAIVIKIKKEIDSLYAEAPVTPQRGIHADDVMQTQYRVEDDYRDLLRQCQELVQFQNKVGVLGDDQTEAARRADEWLRSLDDNVRQVDSDTNLSIEEKKTRIEQLNQQAAEHGHLEAAEAASGKLLGLLETADVDPAVSKRYQQELNERSSRHSDVLDRIQDGLNATMRRLAANEDLKESVAATEKVTEGLEKKVAELKDLPLRENSLVDKKREEQLLRSEIDSRMVLVDELEKEVKKAAADSSELKPEVLLNRLAENRKRLQRTSSDLKGYRDNVNDALHGVQSLVQSHELLARASDAVAATVRAVPTRDAARLDLATHEVDGLDEQLATMRQTADRVMAYPGVDDSKWIDTMLSTDGSRIDAIAAELDAKRKQQAELGDIEMQFDGHKYDMTKYLDEVDENIEKLGGVSVDRSKLSEQREQLAEVSEKHKQGQAQLEELEQLSMQLSAAEGGGRASSVPRHVLDLLSRYTGQAENLKSRSMKLNRNDEKRSEIDDAVEDLAQWLNAQHKTIEDMTVPTTKEAAQSQLSALDRADKATRNEQRRLDEAHVRARDLAREAELEGEATVLMAEQDALSDRFSSLNDKIEGGRERARKAERVLDGMGQLDKWLTGKKRLIEAVGAPSTESSLARAQLGQIQIMKAEAANEQPALESLNENVEQLAANSTTDNATEGIRNKMLDVKRRWKSLEEGLNNVEHGVKKASELGEDARKLIKDLKRELAEVEAGVDAASALSSSDTDVQNIQNKATPSDTLDSMRNRVGALDELVSELEKKVVEAEELGVDPGNRGDLTEAVDSAKRKAKEIEDKISGVQKASQSAAAEGAALEQQLDALVAVVRQAESDIKQAPAPTADLARLEEQLTAVDDLYSQLRDRDGEVGVVKAKATEQLKKMSEPVVKAKLDELIRSWKPLIEAARDRRQSLSKVADLVGQFGDSEKTLGDRLKESEKNLDVVVDDDEASDTLRDTEAELLRRATEADALSALAGRIDLMAPGPDANKLKRKAENLGDDCKALAKRVKAAAAVAQKKVDLSAKLDALIEDARQFAAVQRASLAHDSDHRSRLHARIADVESTWNRLGRDIRNTSDELLKVLGDEDSKAVQDVVAEVSTEFEDLLTSLKELLSKLDQKKDEVERLKETSNRVTARSNSLNEELGDLEPIGRNREILGKQQLKTQEMLDEIDKLEAEVGAVESEWSAALEGGVVTKPQSEANKTLLDGTQKVIRRGRKKLGERVKKIEQTENDVNRIDSDATGLEEELAQVLGSDVLTQGVAADPKAQAEQLKNLKETLKPLARKVDGFTSDCKVLIKTADADADTTELDKSLGRVTDAWAAVDSSVAERERALDAAVQQMGRYEDAHKALVNWLEETEEMLGNQRPPSADSKVAKAQLHAYDVLLKHIEDKDASFKGFSALVEKFAALASSDEEKKGLKQKEEQLWNRYNGLLEDARDRQQQLMKAVDLAERLVELVTPLESFLNQAEKRVQALGSVPTDAEKAMDLLKEQQDLEQELDDRTHDVNAVLDIVPLLHRLVSVEDASGLEAQAGRIGDRYESLVRRVGELRDILHDTAEHVAAFTETTTELSAWMEDMEHKVLDLDELPIEPDDLIEQCNILTELAEIVVDRDTQVSDVIDSARELSRQANTDDAIALQGKIETLKLRYTDIMAVADEKLALLQRAIPLSERFHEGFDAVMQWVEAVEDDLLQMEQAEIETQAHLIFTMEEDLGVWRPEVEDLVVVSNQLQALCSPERSDELFQNTSEMNRRVNQIADKVSRRAERLDYTEKASRQVLDELDFLVEWLSDARERVVQAGAPSIDPQYVRSQLKNQRIMNDDVTANKARLRDVLSEARKFIRQTGDESAGAYDAVAERCETAKELVDEVACMCMDRTEILERALVLAQQLTTEFDELGQWVDAVVEELRIADPVTTATPSAELRNMHEHNQELLSSIAAYRPIVDRFERDVSQLQEICIEDESGKLGELAQELIDKYNEVSEVARARGRALDSMVEATSGFGERLETFVRNLQGAADRLKNNDVISADPIVLQSRLEENQAILDGLRQKETAYAALKESAGDLLASAPQGDVGAADVTDKLGRLEKLWREIEKEAVDRGAFLVDVLEKASHFWSELDACQKAVDDLRVKLDGVEPAVGRPEELQSQQGVMVAVGAELSATEPRIIRLREAGDALCAVIPPEEQQVIRSHVDAVHGGFGTITKLFADKNRDLISAMEDAMSFHGDLSGLLEWLAGAEQRIAELTSTDEIKVDEIYAHLDAIHLFKDEVNQKAVLKEQLCDTASQIAVGAPPHLAAAVRQPVGELSARWNRLNAQLADREQKVERALLQMGRLSEAADQLIAWMDKTRTTLDELVPKGANVRNIEIQKCKLTVVKNDVISHEPSVATLNAAAARLLKEESSSDAARKVDTMNAKWRQLHSLLESLASQMDKARNEAESVGGEMERWLSWLEDMEAQLATKRPTGGLPETANEQMDQFRVLRAEVEQNSSALDKYIRDADRYMSDHGNDEHSWIGRNHGTIKNKWTRVKTLCQDRENKLKVALDEAEKLEESMKNTTEWLNAADQKIVQWTAVSRLPEKVAEQLAVHEQWMDDVSERKQLMAEQHAVGTRIQYYCEKKDAIPIKNALVSLKHRFEKISSRSHDRQKQLLSASGDAAVWANGVEDLATAVDDLEDRLSAPRPATSSVDKLREHLDIIQAIHSDTEDRQSQFDITKKRGLALAEHAPKPDARVIRDRTTGLAKRWQGLQNAIADRKREAEQALLEGGAFEESTKTIEDWLDAELARCKAEDNDKVLGDVDVVRELCEEEKRKENERKAKKAVVEAVVNKASELMSQDVAESSTIEASAIRLQDKWEQLERFAQARKEALAEAAEKAAEFDAKAHALLDWLAAQENRLMGPNADLSVALDVVATVRAEMSAARPQRDECLAAGSAIQQRVHPRADQNIKHWLRVVETRWKEVEERAGEREFALLEDEQREKERDAALTDLQRFVANKREQLARMIAQPMAEDLKTLNELQHELEELDVELRAKQTEVDTATKAAKMKSHPGASQLSSEWKQLWLDLLGYQSALEAQKNLLEEQRRLEGWKWEDWKERYVEWNDHGKARVSDLFRRIDRQHTGNVPRNIFIDAVIASKFPTSRLEMAKVADLFDKGDGLINSKEFINALRFDNSNRKEPATEQAKINEEISRQTALCSCCQSFKIEKIAEGRYRFGDLQIKRMVRILRSTVMVRVGGGWEPLDEFLSKHDPCRVKGRLNINLLYKDPTPTNSIDTMRAFTKTRHAKTPTQGTPGPIMKIREKTERSLPMFPQTPQSRQYRDRADSDMSLADSRIGRPSLTSSRTSLLESSRPPSRASDLDPDRPTRIPSLRGRKSTRHTPTQPMWKS